MSLQRFLFISALLAGSAVAAFGQSTPKATNTTTITRTYVFPAVNLNTGETARVIVLNSAPAATSSSSSSSNNPAPSCTGSISFLSSANGSLPSPVTFTLGAGQFAYADLHFSATGISSAPGPVTGSVAQTFSEPSAAPCSLQMSLVTFDSTGASHLIVVNPSVQTIAIPTPIFGGR